MKTPTLTDELTGRLVNLKLPWIRENDEPLATQAVEKSWSHVEFFARLIEGETQPRMDRATQRRIKDARFPVLK